MPPQPSRIAAEKAIAKLKALCWAVDVPGGSDAPALMSAVMITLRDMVVKLEHEARGNPMGDDTHDDMMWNFVRKAAEQAIADVKALAAKLKYDIF